VRHVILVVMLLAACGPASRGDAPADAAPPAPDGTPLDLIIEPAEATIDADGSPQTLALTARMAGQPRSDVLWSLDDVRVGSIGADGVFASPGDIAGTVIVEARYGNLVAHATIKVRVAIRDNVAVLTPAQQAALDAGGPLLAGFRWLYPYDRTVFPRGLAAPFLQLDGGRADALLITATAGDFSYRGYFGTSSPAGVTLSPAIWKALTLSAAATDDVEISATRLTDQVVTGPIAEHWRIAAADLRGIIYYNTYQSPRAGGAAIMRVRPGQDAEVFQAGCTACHSVSARGNVLVTGVGWDWGQDGGNPVDAGSFSLAPDGTSAPRFVDGEGRKLAMGALTPDGSLVLGNGNPGVAPPIRGLNGDFPSRLYDTASGAVVDAPTFTDQVSYAVGPSFSPDGQHLAFTWLSSDDASYQRLMVMNVDLGQSPPVFSGLRQVASATSGVVAWPSFLADGRGLLYGQSDRFDTVVYGGAPSYGELRLVDTQTMAVSSLAELNGWHDGVSALPGGEAEDNARNYEPSVLPVPVGGYYWVMFTSRRTYGHTLAPGGTVAGSGDEWGTITDGVEIASARKKIWVAAIDLDYQGQIDPSHAAFYLPGQELEAGNMRAFAALEPCRQLAASCSSGSDCCDGFCRPDGADGELVCVEPPGDCSQIDESCHTAADCCEAAAGAVCVNDRCAQPNPIP
jgi:hypothetical protein